MADADAIKAVLQFKRRWKPDTTVHLGDWLDTTAFRKGAAGTSDQRADVDLDIEKGNEFLSQLEPQIVMAGNHEDRLWGLTEHPDAKVASLAGRLIKDITTLAKSLKAELVPYHYKAYKLIGKAIAVTHGTVYNETAPRDMAEMFAPIAPAVVFAHTHKAGYANGRTMTGTGGYCVGTLARINEMEFAKARRATLAWSGGFVWGEYNNNGGAQLWVHDNRQEQVWHLPPV